MRRRTTISNSKVALSSFQASNVKLKQQVLSKPRKSLKFNIHMPTPKTVLGYSGAFLALMTLVGVGYQPQTANGANVASVTESAIVSTPEKSTVDNATAVQVASDIAKRADLPVAANISSLSISLSAKSKLTQSDTTVINKPQIIQPTSGSRAIGSYTTKDGDTVQSVAEQYHLTAQTIKWANKLNSDTIAAGTELTIPPVDGLVYTVKDGETAATIADKYKADVEQIVSFNDLELSDVTSGQKIVVPAGTLPTEEQPGYVAPQPQSTGYASSSATTTLPATGYGAISAQQAAASVGNSYAFGNCTWWAYERRAQLGRPVGSFWGNAATWDIFARAAGYPVDKTPSTGAVFQMPAFVDAYTGSYGHVGIVESVNADGSVNVSEMNYAGNFNRVTNRTIPAAQAALYNYIH
jgi:surface antigen